MDLLLRYGPALPGIAAVFLCARPSTPQGRPVSGELT